MLQSSPKPSPFRFATKWFDWTKPVSILFSLFLALLIILPMGWLLYMSFVTKAGAFTLAHYVRALTDPSMVKPLLLTLYIATVSGLLCVVTAVPMGWLVARTDLPFKRSLRALVMASFVTPPFLGAFAWTLLAGPNSGMINQWYRSLFRLDPSVGFLNIYSVAGLIFVIFLYTFPYVFTLVTNALELIPADLEDASSMLGAKSWQTGLKITFPLAMPAILAGFLVAFLQAMTLFGSPAILAIPAGIHTLTTKIWSLFQFPPNPGLAAALSMPLLLITVGLLRAQHWILGRKGYAIVGGKSGQQRLVKLGAWKWLGLLLFLAVLGNSVLLPYGALLKAVFVKVWSNPITLDNLTFKNIHFVYFEYSSTRLALKNTLVLGTLTATLGTILATMVGYLTIRKAVWGHRALGFLAMAPIAIPGIVLAVGLFFSYTRQPLVLYGTLWILLMAYLTKELPSGFQQVSASLKAIHPELEEASRILGASRLRSLWDITAPLIRSGVLATWSFIFIGVIRELSATILLVSSKTKVVSVMIYDLKESNDWGAISVLGVTMLLVTFVIILLINRIPAGQSSN